MIKSSTGSHNSSDILRLIKERGELSRADISRSTGLTRPAVSGIVTRLKKAGYIKESRKGESSGGKPPIMLELEKESVFAVGIDLADEFALRGVLCNFHGEIVRKMELPYKNDFDSILDNLFRLIEFLTDNGIGKRVKGVGLAVSGIVDRKGREIICSANFDIAGKNIAGRIEDKTGLPVFLEKRPNAAALAEKTSGAGKELDDFVYISTGKGMGAGIIHNGRIFRGNFGGAGEIGKMPLSLDSNSDSQNKNNLESKIREASISEAIQKLKGKKLENSEIIRLFEEGDSDIEKVIFENADYLASAAGIVCNILNPQAVILGGRIRELGEKYVSRFNERFRRLLSVPFREDIKVLLSQFGRDGVAMGGAVSVLNKVINFKI